MELQRALGRVEGQLKSLVLEMQESNAIHHSTALRVTSLEKWRVYTVGFCAGVAGVYVVVSDIFGLLK